MKAPNPSEHEIQPSDTPSFRSAVTSCHLHEGRSAVCSQSLHHLEQVPRTLFECTLCVLVCALCLQSHWITCATTHQHYDGISRACRCSDWSVLIGWGEKMAYAAFEIVVLTSFYFVHMQITKTEKAWFNSWKVSRFVQNFTKRLRMQLFQISALKARLLHHSVTQTQEKVNFFHWGFMVFANVHLRKFNSIPTAACRNNVYNEKRPKFATPT